MSHDNPAITALFNTLAGTPVNVQEKREEFVRNGVRLHMVTYIVDDNDPAIKALTEAATQAGLLLQLWINGEPHERHFRRNLLNAAIDRDAKGVYRLAQTYRIGD